MVLQSCSLFAAMFQPVCRVATGHFFQRAMHGQLRVELVSCFEAFQIHSGRWAYAIQTLTGVRNKEGTVLPSQETSRMKSLKFLAFAQGKTLTDINEWWNYRVFGPQLFCNPGAEMRGSNGLGRLVAGVPMILMPGVKDETHIRSYV